MVEIARVAESSAPGTAALWRDGIDLVDGGRVEVRFAGKGLPGCGPGEPREHSARAIVPDGTGAAWLRQVHGAEVLDARPGEVGDGDALVTDRADLGLVVVTADCVPVLLAAPGRVAAVHAGWRGVVAGVVTAASDRFGAPPRVAWIGPAISGEVYEVGDDVADQVVAVSDPEVAHVGPRGRRHVDLQRAVAIQLARAGVDDVRVVGPCTFTAADELWSYRRDGSPTGRNVSAIWRTGRESGNTAGGSS